MSDRLRFGMSVSAPTSGSELAELGRWAEGNGFDMVQVPDHLGIPAPFSVLASVAAATSELRVGTLVVNHDFWNPLVLAREAATLAVLSDGRFELGIGAGHARVEYEAAGIAYDPPADRVERLAESVPLLRRLLDGETVTAEGAHHRLADASIGFPVPFRVPILVGGNGDRVLALAARDADVVGLTGFRSGDGQVHTDLSHFRWSGLDERIDHVRRAAGERMGDLEVQVLVQHVAVGDRDELVVRAAEGFGHPVELLADSPFVMVGSVGELVEHCHRLREHGVSAVTAFRSQGAEQLAPVVSALD